MIRNNIIEDYESLQKFPIGSIVTINRPDKHGLDTNIGVVKYSYGQVYKNNQNSFKEYALVLLDENGLPYNAQAWFNESELKWESNDIEYGNKLIQYYNEKVDI